MHRPFEAESSALFPERRPLYPDNFNNFAMAGRRVLITGAGRSIGSAFGAKDFAAHRHSD
jgi:FlaA1/EpsC-like NDP-sugar epimerase